MEEFPNLSKSKQNEDEKKLLRKRIGDWHSKDSIIRKELERHLGPDLSRNQLLSLAKVISNHTNIPIDREASRRKEVLFKWFDEHSNQVLPFLYSNIEIETNTGETVTFESKPL